VALIAAVMVRSRLARATIQPILQPLGPQLVYLDALLEASDLGLESS